MRSRRTATSQILPARASLATAETPTLVAMPPGPRHQDTAIAAAVASERDRIAGDRPETAEPDTVLGRHVKKQTDVPTVLLDRIVRDVATTKLKQFRGRSKPSRSQC